MKKKLIITLIIVVVLAAATYVWFTKYNRLLIDEVQTSGDIVVPLGESPSGLPSITTPPGPQPE